jgi:hypothetical protein
MDMQETGTDQGSCISHVSEKERKWKGGKGVVCVHGRAWTWIS